MIYEYGKPMWNDIDGGKLKNEIPDPVPLCPSKIAHGLTWA
jgi:hypothetical protein